MAIDVVLFINTKNIKEEFLKCQCVSKGKKKRFVFSYCVLKRITQIKTIFLWLKMTYMNLIMKFISNGL